MADAALVITGATASGKSAVAMEVARRLGGEIISMDSRQVYRGMDIGTAKATPAERAEIPHHGIDLITPDRRYSAGEFARDARRWIGEVQARGRVPVVAGGTGFFLRALLEPMFAEPPLDEQRREALKQWLAAQDAAMLARWAAALEPVRAMRVQDRQRHARIIEVALLTGHALAWWHQHSPPAQPPVPARCFVIELPRTVLHDRIDARVHQMVAAGFADEVRDLLRQGYGPADPGMNATGYIELAAHVLENRPLADAVEEIQRATRRFARRQLTWFRHQLPESAVRLDASAGTASMAAMIVEAWRRQTL